MAKIWLEMVIKRPFMSCKFDAPPLVDLTEAPKPNFQNGFQTLGCLNSNGKFLLLRILFNTTFMIKTNKKFCTL